MSDWFRISNSATTRAAVYNACRNVNPQTGSSNQISRSGRNWTWGNYIPTRYNHVMPPNSRSCSRGSGGRLDAKVNNAGGATTASSYHPTGVNLALATVKARYGAVGTRVRFEVTAEYERRTVTATVVKKPLFDPERKRL